MKKYFKELVNTIKSDRKKIAKLCKDNFELLLDMIYVIVIILSICLKPPEVAGLILLISLYFILSFIKKVFKKANLSFPILNYDLTEENENGDIIVKEGDLQKLIIYCNTIERYIKKTGLR